MQSKVIRSTLHIKRIDLSVINYGCDRAIERHFFDFSNFTTKYFFYKICEDERKLTKSWHLRKKKEKKKIRNQKSRIVIALIEWKYFIRVTFWLLILRCDSFYGKTHAALTHHCAMNCVEWNEAKESAWLARFFYAQECIQHKCRLPFASDRFERRTMVIALWRHQPTAAWTCHELAATPKFYCNVWPQERSGFDVALRLCGPLQPHWNHHKLTVWIFCREFIGEIPCASEMFPVDEEAKKLRSRCL